MLLHMTTKLFPAGSKLLVKITALEIKHDIFIPGHRTEPFRNPATAPWDLLLQDETGNLLNS